MGKRGIIETLQMSVSIAKDAIEALKRTNAIKATETVKLKVENVGLSVQIDRQASLLESFQAKCDSLLELHEQTKEDLLSENSRLLHSIPHKKPRTYFEIASSEPLKLFEAGDVVHVIREKIGFVYNVIICESGSKDYPLSACEYYFKTNGIYYAANKLRSLFTTAEMIEMGYEIPDME